MDPHMYSFSLFHLLENFSLKAQEQYFKDIWILIKIQFC
jgi:hypothetical protein